MSKCEKKNMRSGKCVCLRVEKKVKSPFYTTFSENGHDSAVCADLTEAEQAIFVVPPLLAAADVRASAELMSVWEKKMD